VAASKSKNGRAGAPRAASSRQPDSQIILTRFPCDGIVKDDRGFASETGRGAPGFSFPAAGSVISREGEKESIFKKRRRKNANQEKKKKKKTNFCADCSNFLKKGRSKN
jgi:hypothetical protein